MFGLKYFDLTNYISVGTSFFSSLNFPSVFNNKLIISTPFSSVISKIKLWNGELNYVLVFSILRSFNLTNSFYLKSLFLKFIKDLFIWNQVNKMLATNRIGITGNLIYNSRENICSTKLSSFLLNLYLMDFDNYIRRFIFKYHFNRNFLDHSPLFFKFLTFLTPLKLLNNFFDFKSLKILGSNKYSRIYNAFVNSSKITYNFNYYIAYVRYLDSVIFGCTCSRLFVYFLLKKLQNFLQVRLNFTIKQFTIFRAKQKNIIFLFYRINLFPNHCNSTFNFLHTNKLFFSKTFFRIIYFQKKIANSFLKRFRLELTSNFKYKLEKSLTIQNFRKIFSILIFQLEAINSIKINKLALGTLKKNFISNNILSEIRLPTNTIYCKYLFNLYILRIQSLLKNTLNNLVSCFLYGSFSTDFFLYNCLLEIKKKILLIKNVYYFNAFFFQHKRYFFNLLYFFNINFYTKNVSAIKKKLSNYKKFFKNSYLTREKYFFFLIPVNLLTAKLKLLGFLHSYKNCPIGNLSLIFFSDNFIIQISSYIVYSLLCWFSFCDNFFKLKFFIRLIRESCLLTLCRKHNKTKSWVYALYTYDLILFKNLYYGKVFFPTVKFIKELQNKNYFLQENFDCDEFFLFE